MERPSFDRADYSIRDLQFCNGELSTLRVEKKKKKRKREKNIRKKVHSFRSTFPEELEISRGDFSRVEIFILMMDFARSSSSKRDTSMK